VFTAAHAQFAVAIQSDAYRASLPQHLNEAVAAIGDETAAVVCSPALGDPVTAILAGSTRVSIRTDPAAAPGIRVVTEDGAIEVDNTLSGRLARLRPQLELELLRRLETP